MKVTRYEHRSILHRQRKIGEAPNQKQQDQEDIKQARSRDIPLKAIYLDSHQAKLGNFTTSPLRKEGDKEVG